MFHWMNKFHFTENNFLPVQWFNETGELQALHLLKRFCLEYAQYENSPKECCQSIIYATK